MILSKYRLLDLILGNERNDGYSLKRNPSISPIMRSELRFFPGALLVSGSYVGSDNQAPADSTFLAEALYTKSKLGTWTTVSAKTHETRSRNARM